MTQYGHHLKHKLANLRGSQQKLLLTKTQIFSCKQPPRHKNLPASCVRDLEKYRLAGLFELSDSFFDQYCANITLVLKSTGKEARDSTKATKDILKKKI